MFPDIIVSSLCLHHAGLSSNQKSLVLASTGGDTSLETMKKHMRRILQPCGVDLKQDALIADDDLNEMRPASVTPNDLNVKVNLGEAQVASDVRGSPEFAADPQNFRKLGFAQIRHLAGQTGRPPSRRTGAGNFCKRRKYG